MAKYDVFISYSRLDTKIADRICEAFDAAGITYFIDRQGLSAGMEFPKVLADAIENSKLFLFLASQNSYKSKFTDSEITYAFNIKEKGNIIPYIIDGSTLPKHLQFVFSSINWRVRKHNDDRDLIFDITRLSGESTSTLIQNINRSTNPSVFYFFVTIIGLSFFYVLPCSRKCFDYIYSTSSIPFYLFGIILLPLIIISFYLLVKYKSKIEASETYQKCFFIIYLTLLISFTIWLIDSITLPLFSFSFYSLIHLYGSIDLSMYVIYSVIFICYSIYFKTIHIKTFSNIYFNKYTTIGILLYSFLGIAYTITRLYIYGSFYLTEFIPLLTSYFCVIFSLISLKKAFVKK